MALWDLLFSNLKICESWNGYRFMPTTGIPLPFLTNGGSSVVDRLLFAPWIVISVTPAALRELIESVLYCGSGADFNGRGHGARHFSVKDLLSLPVQF